MIHRFSQPIGPYNGNYDGNGGFIGNRSDMEREFPLVQAHDMESADLKQAMNVATEVCNVSGALVDINLRTDNNGNADGVWDEDADPTYWAAVQLKAFFAPGAIEMALKTWGSDAQVKLEMYFSMQMLVHKFGTRVLRKGDVIFVPFNAVGNIAPKHFRVTNFTPVGNYRYAWLYGKCNCESMSGDMHIIPRDMQGEGQGVRVES